MPSLTHEEKHNNTLTLAEENERLMMKGLNQISNTVTNAVMVLGRTGSGKSALINLLAGKPLFASRHRHTRELFLDSPEMLPEITIGNEHPSETSIPHAWIYNDNTAFWDCPGFDDNRGVEYEITNAFLFKKLFDAHRTCKILIVVSDVDLNDIRALLLLSAVRALDAFFQSDIERIRPGLMLVVSRADPDKTVIQIRDTFQSIIDTTAFALTDRQKDIFRVFKNNPIIMFKKPVVEGAFDTACAQEYLETIGNLGVINNLQVNSIVSTASNVILLETYANLLHSIRLEIDNLMSSLSLQLQGSIMSSQASRDLQELRTAVEGFQVISNKFDNEVILSNKQLLLEIVPQCMQLNINHSIALPTSKLRNISHKAEIFDFLEQFVARDARVNLGIKAAITGYLSNCMRDANSAIQTIEQQKTGETITTLQFDLQREKDSRVATEKQNKEMKKLLEHIASELENEKNKDHYKWFCSIM
jgi:energy-coupling factor transporter ATP-binding protein EcfA2